MPMTVQELIKMRRMTVHRLNLLVTGEMTVRCLRTALIDNTAAIAAARRQIRNIDAALIAKGHKYATKPFIGAQAAGV